MSTPEQLTEDELATEEALEGSDGLPPLGAPAVGSFAAEFRTLAQRRRFASKRRQELDREAASQARRDTDLLLDGGSDVPDISPVERPEPLPAAVPIAAALDPVIEVPRLSEQPGNALGELSRMADQLVAARERLTVERLRAERAEREAAGAQQRILAARGLVHEAQRTAREAVERSAYLEGRCEALEGALKIASRRGWRRLMPS